MLYHKLIKHPTSKEWTIFIHGAGGSSKVWFKQIRAFSENFNVLMLDLRGHGKSKNIKSPSNYSFEMIADDVVEVVRHNQIERAHFIGVSLGSIVINQIQVTHPDMVKSMVFSGAITRLNVKSRLLLRVGRILNPFLPYMALYALFAQIMMPKKNHELSRMLFIDEAKKLMTHEFNRWFQLTARLAQHLNYLQERKTDIHGLYVMGSEDHLFLEPAKEIVRKNKNLTIEIVPNCGHVVNVEQSEVFNELSIAFIHKVSIA